jgi:hypothetical protein
MFMVNHLFLNRFAFMVEANPQKAENYFFAGKWAEVRIQYAVGSR